MTIDRRPTITEPRSRRAILAGALAGLAGLIAGRAAAPEPTRAAAGDPLLIGNITNNAGTANTTLTTSSTGTGLLITQNGAGTALRGSAVGPGSIAGFFTAQNGTGISGVTGNGSQYGVFAQNNGPAGTAAALRANGGNNHGIVSSTDNAARNAVWGISTGGVGVRGHSSTGPGVTGLSTSGNGVIGGSVSEVGVYGSSGSWVGVGGYSTSGFGVHGESATNYAGFFENHVFIGSWLDVTEIGTPAAPGADQARLFVRDSGGKTQLCVLFPTGAVQVISTEP